MNRIRTVIVDDEELARKRIIKLLAAESDIIIVGEFNNGAEAVSYLVDHPVDILYLDIHMPELDGFSVLNKLDKENRPFVIFATADKASAIKAFEYNALDYLLKPFRKIRFMESLNHAKAYIELKNKARLSDQMTRLMDQHNTSKNNYINPTTSATDFDDILYAKSDGNYLRLYRSRKDYQMERTTLADFVNQLNKGNFLRIHRSLIVNPYFIIKIDYAGNNSYDIYLNDDIKLRSSRSFKQSITDFKLSSGL